MSSLRSLKSQSVQHSREIAELIDNSIDAAQTVLHCAQHQKRIVDDILTISKLDSGLFSITPVQVRPVAVLESLLKMFESEFVANGITRRFHIEESFKAVDPDWVLLDSSRLLQILINLVTNAIKFIKYESTRCITVSIGASLERPNTSVNGIELLPLHREREDITQQPEWGNGEPIYLLFSVQDTGCGLSDDDKKILFMRFSQAPRTHVNYGGSGLGLFICRELTEMQGGAVGVRSERGKGSTFAFYIKARRAKLGDVEDVLDGQGNSCARVLAQNERESYGQATAVQQRMLARSMLRETSPVITGYHQLRPRTPDGLKGQVLDVLIVEDNKINQQVLSKQLVKLGHRVSIANHGLEALDFLRTTNYWKGNEGGKDLSLVLMDVEMPVMDGLSCVKRIRELEQEGDLVRPVPVIAITANARIEQVNMALNAGMVRCMDKVRCHSRV